MRRARGEALAPAAPRARSEKRSASEASATSARGMSRRRRGGATPEAPANAACATERNATRTHSRAGGASGGPADGGRPREGGAEATATAEQSERKPSRTAGAAKRGGATGERAKGEAFCNARAYRKKVPSTAKRERGTTARRVGGRAPPWRAEPCGAWRRKQRFRQGSGADYDTPLPLGVHCSLFIEKDNGRQNVRIARTHRTNVRVKSEREKGA